MNLIAQADALHELHHHHQLVVLAERVVQRCNMGMFQAGLQPDLTQKSLRHFGHRGSVGDNYFERLDALRDGMAHLIDGSHAARAQRRQHFVVANPIAGREDQLVVRGHSFDHGKFGRFKARSPIDFPFCSPHNVCMALTKRQKEVLDFIADFVEENGYSPSYEELAQGLHLASLATVHKHIQALESRNYLRRLFNQSRSLEVSAKYVQERRKGRTPARSIDIPLAGRIAAGAPVEAIEGQDTLQFADFAGKGDTFALQVTGESMIDDHILSGDYVLVERVQQAQDGEIIVALVDGHEATLKRLYHEPDGRIRLQPANASMQPIFVDAASVQIQGRVLAVLRKYK